jgi:hypothetical protein
MVMHRPRSAASRVATLTLSLIISTSITTATWATEAIDRATALLGRGDGRGAVAVLEAALPGARADRAAVLAMLRRAYELAARQAEADGKRTEAETFRDNLEILNRKPRSAAAATAATAARAERDPAVERTAAAPASAPAITEPAPAPASAPSRPEPAAPARSAAPGALNAAAPIDEPARAKEPAAAVPAPAAPEPSIAAADAAFLAKHYDEAGRIYGALDREGRLPRARRDHWAYCRLAAVVKRINANPTSPDEWKRIDAEIQQIRALSPNNWFGEYLRNLTAERAPGRRPRPSQKVVLRGASPDEAPVAPSNPAPAPAPTASASAAPGSWQIQETANFRILHADPALAEQVARLAEATREVQLRRWAGPAPRGAWTPRCDIYIYPTVKVFSRMTGQPEESPGFSTMGMNGGRIIARRVNVRADHPNLLSAILPHEITHVVLADLFPEQQIPRWADEGMAVLSEPASEQRLRAADLDKPLTTGRLFKVGDLMVMDYPDGQYWALYYAQSVSLTRFLVELGTPSQFVRFVQGSQRNGVEAELRRVYQIEGFDDLQNRWLTYARTKAQEKTAAGGEPEARSRQ